MLLGGRTGRDGIGGATGSSKAHKLDSLEHCGAEVQKGNAPIERKLQRLFRREDACKMIKRCNDFVVKGTSEGDWRLPTLFEMIEINGWETESSTGTNQYANLNNKMKLLPQAEQLGYSYLFNYCNSGANDNGGTYLKESPACSNTNKSGTCTGSTTCGSGSWQYHDDCKVDGVSQSPWCTACTVSYSIPATSTLTSNYYWTISETPDSGAYPYYFKLGATNQEKVIKGDSSSKNKKLLYRCVMTF